MSDPVIQSSSRRPRRQETRVDQQSDPPPPAAASFLSAPPPPLRFLNKTQSLSELYSSSDEINEGKMSLISI